MSLSTLVPVDEKDLPTILNWRNHPDVRKVMFQDREITLEEHLAWWSRIKSDQTQCCLLYLHEGKPSGFVHFFDIDKEKKTCHWGFNTDNASSSAQHRMDVWFGMERLALRWAFEKLGCDFLICETFEFNKAVLHVHKKFGFVETSRYKKERNGSLETIVEMTLKNPSIPGDQQHVSAFRLTFLGSANWDLVAQDFIKQAKFYLHRSPEMLFVPFGQYRSLLSDDSSSLRSDSLDYVVFCERFEDFLDSAFSVFSISDKTALRERFDEYCDVVRAARPRLAGRFLLLDLSPVRAVSTTLDDGVANRESVAAFVEELNLALRVLCNELPDCHLVTLSSVVRQFGATNADPGKYWHLGRVAYPAAFGRALNKRILQTIIALEGKSARVLVLDLDNTLWGGVIGDDGLGGIKLGGDYPGTLYLEFQETVKALREKGIALAICSKNTEAVAIEAIESHPSMKLRLKDFVSIRINWRDKVENLREIAAQIGVGLSSLCFIDDSPYERAAIRQQLPEVVVPEMPPDVALWSDFLFQDPFLASLELTEEDKTRARRYELKVKFDNEIRKFENKEEYWKSLGMKLYFHEFSELNKQRVMQLITKTNQFNMTTHRYKDSELDGVVNDGGKIVPIGLADKFSDHEIIGVLVLRPGPDLQSQLVIETFLLSCRVLGRSVESGILAWLSGFALSRGYSELLGLFSPTERNQPASKVYAEHGFVDQGNGRFMLDLRKQALAVPAWFEIIESR